MNKWLKETAWKIKNKWTLLWLGKFFPLSPEWAHKNGPKLREWLRIYCKSYGAGLEYHWRRPLVVFLSDLLAL